jgi:ABC-type branched-subunit amino acid transport system substrate-binding protein
MKCGLREVPSCRGALAGCVALLLAAVASAAEPRGIAGDAQQIELGRRLFHEGRNAQGEPVRALLGASVVPLAGPAVACGNCHGADGRGRPEGGVVPPDITWDELTKPYGHQHPSGRRHGPFDQRSFARAVTEGVDPDGGRIDAAMPRYALSASETAALWAYLKTLAHERDPGVLDATIRLGTVLPDSGPAAEIGRAIRAMLRAYVNDLNERGGVHARRVELVVASDLDQAARRFGETPVFALVSPYAVGAETSLLQFAAERRLALIGPFTLATTPDASLQTFFLLAGEADLARVLLAYATANPGGRSQRWAALLPDPDGATAHAVRSECQRRGCGSLEVLPAGAALDPGAVARLMHLGVQSVLFAGSEREFAALTASADRLGWHPAIYTPVAGLARAMAAAPPAFAGRLFGAYPMRADAQHGGAAARSFEKLRRDRGLGDRHAAAQRFAYAAMAIVEEALRQAGRDVSRERFARAVEGLHRFDAGPLPPISYGPARRVGALGGYVVAIGPQGEFRPVSDWIAIDAR